MNLLDLLDDSPAAPLVQAPADFSIGQIVRAADGRFGEVRHCARVSDRLGVQFPGEPVWRFVHRAEVVLVEGHEHVWDNTESIWPGEMSIRLTRTCATCGVIHGRMS